MKDDIWVEPCPYCSSDDVKIGQIENESTSFILCMNQDCRVYGPMEPTLEDAVRVWNEVAKLVQMGRLHNKT